MARPIAGDVPAALPPSPFQTPPNGLAQPVPGGPFNYTNQPSMPAPAVPATPTPAGLLNAFRRRWVLSTFLGALVAAAVAIGAWVALPAGKHQVRAIVQLKTKGLDIVGRAQEDFGEYRSRQKYLLKSRELITQTLNEPAVASLDTVKAADNAVQMVEDSLRVAIVADDILEVSMTGNNIDDMKVILDHLVKRYVDIATGSDRRQLDDQKKKLEQLSEAMRVEIDAAEKNIDMLVRANGTTGGQDNEVRQGILARRLAEVEGDYNRLGREIGRLEAEVTVVKKQLELKEKAPIDPLILQRLVRGDKNYNKAEGARDIAKRAYDSAFEVSGKNPDNDVVKETKGELEKAEAALDAAKKTAEADAAAEARVFDAASRQAKLNDLIMTLDIKGLEREKLRVEKDVLQNSLRNGAVGAVDIQRLRESLKPQREALDRINVFLAQLRVTEKIASRVELRGEVEKVPNSNQNRKIAMSGLGGLGSFFGVVLLVSFLEWRTRRVDGVDQVVTELGLRVIGTVPAFPNRANLKAAVEAGGANWRFVLNESINSARTMLLHTARTQSMQVVMVTSATQGEGKTSLASQLATSMATAGMRTLIVDCDLRNPSVQKLFELPLGPGVSEVLRQEVDVSDVVQATAVPNLWVIPAGQCSNATIAALAQGHPMETLFNRLRGQFDFIIVDSCPVLPVADALLIGQHVDGVVFSIMQDISQLPKVMTATEKLNQLNIPLVGAVVNGIKQDVYSYGYNYVKQLPA
ncbi:MAG: polysaccharide biosynthesis tyrosine autokinase [Planctomycetes bacterium]|nr:polysaccharide biosynthesis tyrosine autokinase [Planctomycetota bacterium]